MNEIRLAEEVLQKNVYADKKKKKKKKSKTKIDS